MGTSLVGGGVTALRVLQQPLALRCQNWGLPTVPEVWSPHHQLRLLQDWGSHAHPPPLALPSNWCRETWQNGGSGGLKTLVSLQHLSGVRP